MKDDSVKICRTCLKKSTETFSVNDLVVGARTKLTYGQLLKECTNIEYLEIYEHLMPQNLCSLCCQELETASSFIRQAQHCNNKLINLLATQLRTVVKTENELLQVNMQKNERNEDGLHSTLNEFRVVSTDVLLKPVELEETVECYKPIKTDDNESDEAEMSDSLPNSSNTAQSTPTTTCPICEKATSGHNSLISHIRIEHDIDSPSKYLNKRKNLNTKRSKITSKSKPKERIFKCSSCDYRARTYGAINFHNRSKHGTEDDKFKCNFCPYTSYTKFKLFLHVKKSHKEEIKALKMDPENNLNSSEFLRNMPTANETNKVADKTENSSDVCTTSVTQMAIITPPEDKTTDQEEEELSDELFIRNILNVKKRQHQTVSTNLLPRRCDECGNIYNNLQALKTHKRNVHISEEQYHICPHCGKKYKRSENMRIHIRNAHNPNFIRIRKKPTKQTKEKCFMCSQCSYVCVTKSTLTHHVNRHHTGEKPHKCDVCNKSFVVAFDLKIHSYLHTGERPYKCLVCSKRFRCSSHLVKHRRIHNNERPYKCKDCDKTFTQCYNLTLHKRVHLKEKNFKCMVCSKLFENQSLLNAHRMNENHYDEIE